VWAALRPMQKRHLITIERKDMVNLVVDAIQSQNGKATIIQVAEFIWTTYEKELRQSGDIFYTWQYDIRWARHRLAT